MKNKCMIDPSLIPNFEKFNDSEMQERYFIGHWPDFHAHISSHFPSDLKWGEKLYWFVHKIKDYPLCPVCGKRLPFRRFKVGYRTYCSATCAYKSNKVRSKRESTCLKKYGVSNPMQNSEIQKKRSHKVKEDQFNIEQYLQNDPDLKSMTIPSLEDLKTRSQFGTPYIKKRWPIFYAYLCYKWPQARSTSERLYLWFHRNESVYVCPVCGKPTKYENFRMGYRIYCSSICSNRSESVRDKKANTCIAHYGRSNPMQMEHVKQKHKADYKKAFEDRYPGVTFIDDETLRIDCPHPDCVQCTEKYSIIPKYLFDIRKQSNIELCTRLCPRGQSTSGTFLENIVRYVLDKNGIEYRANVRGLIGKQEIDVYVPSKKIGVECNGVYWHSSDHKPVEYHKGKWEECRKQDIQLLTFWEDQIRTKIDIIQAILCSKLGIYDRTVYARSCLIKEIEPTTYKQFCNTYHLQGYVGARICYGLYHGGQLVSVMSFGISRGRRDKTWELMRYCVKGGWNIVGGASKLFARFIKEYNPKSIISFSSNDISNGDLYKVLGFRQIGTSLSYWYVDPISMKRYHRSSFTKDRIVRMGWKPNKDGWTESEVMKEHGYIKICDTGQTKWCWSNQQ